MKIDSTNIIHLVCETYCCSSKLDNVFKNNYIDGAIVREYGNILSLIGKIPEDGVVLVCDCGNWLNLSRQIEQLVDSGLLVPVVVLAQDLPTHKVVDLIRAGALDCLSLDSDPALIAERIKEVLDLSHRYRLVYANINYAKEKLSLLTPREREVLDWIANGYSSKECARALSISPRTVEVHRGNIMEKTGAKNIAELARVHLREKLAFGKIIPSSRVLER